MLKPQFPVDWSINFANIRHLSFDHWSSTFINYSFLPFDPNFGSARKWGTRLGTHPRTRFYSTGCCEWVAAGATQIAYFDAVQSPKTVHKCVFGIPLKSSSRAVFEETGCHEWIEEPEKKKTHDTQTRIRQNKHGGMAACLISGVVYIL